MYDEACEIQDEMCKNKLSEIWKRFPTDYRAAAKRSDDDDDIDTSNLPTHFYLNTTTGSSQWSTPYYANSYPSVDIEVMAFEKCVMNRDIIEKWYCVFRLSLFLCLMGYCVSQSTARVLSHEPEGFVVEHRHVLQTNRADAPEGATKAAAHQHDAARGRGGSIHG